MDRSMDRKIDRAGFLSCHLLTATRRALRILNYRFNSEAELRRKLQRKEFDAESIEATMIRLRREKWLDDARFAGAFVRAKSTKRVGRRRIARETGGAGVAGDMIAQAIGEHVDPESESVGTSSPSAVGRWNRSRAATARATRRRSQGGRRSPRFWSGKGSKLPSSSRCCGRYCGSGPDSPARHRRVAGDLQSGRVRSASASRDEGSRDAEAGEQTHRASLVSELPMKDPRRSALGGRVRWH